MIKFLHGGRRSSGGERGGGAGGDVAAARDRGVGDPPLRGRPAGRAGGLTAPRRAARRDTFSGCKILLLYQMGTDFGNLQNMILSRIFLQNIIL